MNEQPRITVHEGPFAPFVPPEQLAVQRTADKRTQAAAVKEASQREMEMLRAMNPPRPRDLGPPPVAEPLLAPDFAEQAAAIDNKIAERGVAINRDRLLEQGRQRFDDLLLLDHRTRSLERVLFNDLTSWPAVAHSFMSATTFRANVPPRRIKEQFAGLGEDREQASKINGWEDLWKLYPQEPESVRNVYDFRDAFDRLVFGMSLLDRLSKDGRVRSSLFAGGKGRKVQLFADWLSVLEGPHFTVTLAHPLFAIVSWLAQERTPLAESTTLAFDWLGKRAPAPSQLRLCEAVVTGFLRGYHSWQLWDFVGRRSRRPLDLNVLELWRKDLSARYPRISRFHDDVRAFFFKPGGAGAYQFDAKGYRLFIDRQMRTLLKTVSLLIAQAMEGACVARFTDGWVLCQGTKPKSLPTIERKLTAAFPRATFNVAITEAKS
jgi:hypothetical protein